MLYPDSEVRQSSKGQGWIVIVPQAYLDEMKIKIKNNLDSHL